MTIVHLALSPRDGFFFKDGRGWFSSASNRGRGLPWPFPSTLRGALRTAYGRTIEAARGSRLDKAGWLTETADVRLHATLPLRRRRGGAWTASDRLWPAPSDALWPRGATEALRLDPEPPRHATLGRDDDPAREKLWRPYPGLKDKPAAGPAWWTDAELTTWLTGGSVTRPSDSELEARQPARRIDTHVAIDPETGTAAPGQLYATEVTEPMGRDGANWAIGLAVELPQVADLTDQPVTLGGDRRLAFATAIEGSVFAPPDALVAAFRSGSRGLRLLVATPAELESGWLPGGFSADGDDLVGRLPGIADDVVLRAAFVGRPHHVSGWDMAKGEPKPTRRLVPPGSVYFLEKRSGELFGEPEAHQLWLTAWGRATDAGFGRVVPGIWNPTAHRAG